MATWIKKVNNHKLIIRRAKEEDAAGIKAVYKQQEKKFGHMRSWIKSIRLYPMIIYQIDKEIIGFTYFDFTAVKKEYWGKGIGTAILAAYIYEDRDGCPWDGRIVKEMYGRVIPMIKKLQTELGLELKLEENYFELRVEEGTSKSELNRRIEKFLEKNGWRKVEY